MKIKNVIVLFVVLAMLASMGGCRLAIDEAEVEIDEADSLIGAFITREPLDLFDFEAYFRDNADKFVVGGETVIEDTSGYESKLFAELVDSGSERSGMYYEFTEVEGIDFFVPLVTDEKAAEEYHTTCIDPEVSTVKTLIGSTDDTSYVELEGVLYVTAQDGDIIDYYLNPVYQTPDGRVYTVSGDGMSADFGGSEGASMSLSINTEKTSTVNGETKVDDKSYVKLTIEVLLPPQEISIIQFDADNKVIAVGEYTPDKVPTRITTEPETEYIVVETVKTKGDGSTVTNRSVYDTETKYLDTYCARDDGIVVKKGTEVIWFGTEK